MERSELPTIVMALFSINMPDVIPLGLGLLPFLVKARDIRLVPQVVPDLFHGYLIVGQVLSGEL